MYDKFHSWLTRAAKYPFPQTATQVQDAMLQYLSAHKEKRAVQWFRDYMTGDSEGKWMLAHSTIGSSANNMGNESYYKWIKDACNSRRNVSLNHFLGSYSAYLEDNSALEYGKLLRKQAEELIKRAEESEKVADEHAESVEDEHTPSVYASIPKITIKTWEKVQRLDWNCVSEASIDADEKECERFYAVVDRAGQDFIASKDSWPGIVTLSDAWSCYDTSEVFHATTHLQRVVYCVRLWRLSGVAKSGTNAAVSIS